MILPLTYYGNPILRKKGKPVEMITDEIRGIIFDMIETMDANNGVGLAANQVGVLHRFFVVRPVEELPNGDYDLKEPEIFINPELFDPGEETVVSSEGCLSLPGLHTEVERPYSIRIKALDINGTSFERLIEGFNAREVMHENDHLNGVLFIDRVPKKEKNSTAFKNALRQIKKKYSS